MGGGGGVDPLRGGHGEVGDCAGRGERRGPVPVHVKQLFVCIYMYDMRKAEELR